MNETTPPEAGTLATGAISGGKPVEIRWHDEEMESGYANIATATANREEFYLLFGTHRHWRGAREQTEAVDVELSNRMVMGPHAAKRLAVILSQSVAAYEKQYGVIDV